MPSMAIKQRRPAQWRAFCVCMVCNPQCTQAPNVERVLLFRPLRMAAALKLTKVLFANMGDTRSEPNDQGKHLSTLQSLHLKPLRMLFGLLVACGFAHAQDGRIHRCIGENGEPTFSDQKCSTLKATIAPEVPARAADQTGSSAIFTSQSSAPTITQTCAISAEDLRDRVAGAFQTANAVGFSGLFLWDGFGQGSAIEPLRDLAALIREPLISINLDSTLQFREPDQYRPRNERYEGDALYEIVIRTVGEQERNVPFESVRHYEMREQAGCWWLLIPW